MRIFMISFFLLFLAVGLVRAEDMLLFTIGEENRDYGELAIPGEWERFRALFGQGVEFRVGQDEAAEKWPYVHPGPTDAWAGSRKHEFTIRFTLDEVPKAACALRIALVAGHGSAPPRLGVEINDRAKTLDIPAGPGDAPLNEAAAGRPEAVTLVFGAPILNEGENTLKLTTLSGSWLIYDAVSLSVLGEQPSVTGLEIVPRSVFLHGEEGPRRLVEVRFQGAPLFEGGEITVSIEDEKHTETIPPDAMGTDVLELYLTMTDVQENTLAQFQLKTDAGVIEAPAALTPARKWELYFLHHTHLDIGYTHTQEEVEARQIGFLEEAMALAEKTKDYPPEARFKWLPEGLWPVESYLNAATPEKKEAFIEAVREGSIGLDALYGNALTGLYSQEELFELTGYAVRLAAEHDLTIETAMISDTPGYSWGIVPALAHNGVKYFSMGPNSGHRIGYTLTSFGDKPFYWISPSGKHKVLCWMAGKGYSWFHTGMNAERDVEVINSRRTPERFFEYLDRLEAESYPFDMVQIRYNIGADNGPPDPTLPDFVKSWNEKYAYPRLAIATPIELFKEFESRYAELVPQLKGDFTPYWEDGAASTARDTAVSRAAAERLVQVGALFAMLAPAKYPKNLAHSAWRELVLYDEHTWGAWNSISDPDNPFVTTQAEWKSRCAHKAKEISDDLFEKALAGIEPSAESVLVLNTCSWPRTDLVTLSAENSAAGDLVKDGEGEAVPSQRLTSGALVFLASNVPALGASRFTVEKGSPPAMGGSRAKERSLVNERITLEVEASSGAIASLVWKGAPGDLVDADKHKGLNEYIYVEGRDCDDKRFVKDDVTILVKETGPLVASLLIQSNAPGCRQLEREVRLIDGLDRIEIEDVLYRDKVREPEGIHLAFPFSVPDAVIRLDTPWAVVRPDVDQLRGANKDYFPVQRFVDLSNNAFGVTLVTPDAPMVELGEITMDIRAHGYKWRKKVPASSIVYSYVMNNYWETNYAADQEGRTAFRYALQLHGPPDMGAIQRSGIGFCQPLIAVPASPEMPAPGSLFQVKGNGVLVTSLKPSMDGQALMVRLFNVAGKASSATLEWMGRQPKTVLLSSPREERGEPVEGPLAMVDMEIITLRCEM